MTDVQTMETAPLRLRSARGWLAVAVAVTGSAAWLAVAWAANATVDYAGHLGLVGMSIALGSAELAYLAWRHWTHGDRVIAAVITAMASLASVLIFASAQGDITSQSFVGLAAGVGLLGIATGVGLFAIYRATGKSSPATLTAMLIMAALAYFASVLWAAVG